MLCAYDRPLFGRTQLEGVTTALFRMPGIQLHCLYKTDYKIDIRPTKKKFN